MDKHEKHAYLEAIRKRYRRAKRADKGKILDEFCSVCGYQRKYAIRLLRRKASQTPRRPGQPSRYNQPELLTVLRKIWLATDQMCSRRLVAAMPLWLPHYEASFGALEESVKSRLDLPSVFRLPSSGFHAEIFYKRQRKQARLGYLSPVAFERQFYEKRLAA